MVSSDAPGFARDNELPKGSTTGCGTLGLASDIIDEATVDTESVEACLLIVGLINREMEGSTIEDGVWRSIIGIGTAWSSATPFSRSSSLELPAARAMRPLRAGSLDLMDCATCFEKKTRSCCTKSQKGQTHAAATGTMTGTVQKRGLVKWWRKNNMKPTPRPVNQMSRCTTCELREPL